MALPAWRGIYPLMRLLLLLLFMLELSYGESTTDAPTRSHRNQQQRLQQLQQAQDGIDIGPGHGASYSANQHHHHHLRHEQHLRAELSGSSGNRQPPPPPPPSSPLAARQAELEQLEAMLPGSGQQHHLRHHNRHHAAWEQRVFPALRHQQHRMAPAMTTSSSPFSATTTTTMATPSSLTTDAPLMRVGSNLTSGSSRYFDRDGIYPAWTQPRSTRAPNWQQLAESDESGDDDDDDDDDEDYEDDVDEELAKQMPRYSFFKQKLPEISSNDDDYDAYDQTDVESKTDNDNDNRHPSVASGHSKAAAKRGVFDWFFKRDKVEKGQPVHVLQQQPQTRVQSQVKGPAKPKAATEKPNSVYNDGPRMNEDSFEGFTETEWNKIEYNHHLKQQKHQKELQALRESNRNRPLITAAVGRGAIDNEVRLSGALKSTTVSADAHNMNNYSPNYIPGTLTHQKVERLGNSEAVLKSRRPYEKSHAALASAHWHQVMKSKCQEPQQRCVRIDSDPSKIYMPHCTILHRCAEDSGCCHDPTEICAPKTVHDIELPFIVKSPRNHHTITELLTFVNHTECHCIQRSSYGMESITTNLGVRQATIFNCNCPQYFEKILQNDGQCRCDCSSSNYDCDFRKRGSEHFSMVDRKCIQQGRCKPPTCQFGKYMERQGRCPNENDQMHNQPNPYNPRSLS